MPSITSTSNASIGFAKFVPLGNDAVAFAPAIPYFGRRLFCFAEATANLLVVHVVDEDPGPKEPVTGVFERASVVADLTDGGGTVDFRGPFTFEANIVILEPRFDSTFSIVTLVLKQGTRPIVSMKARLEKKTGRTGLQEADMGEFTYVAFRDRSEPDAPFRIMFIDNVDPDRIQIDDLTPIRANGDVTLILPPPPDPEDGGGELGPMGLVIDDGSGNGGE